MPSQKFTVFLMSQEGGYQVIVPHYPNCTTEGDTVEEALANAKDAMERIATVRRIEARRRQGGTLRVRSPRSSSYG